MNSHSLRLVETGAGASFLVVDPLVSSFCGAIFSLKINQGQKKKKKKGKEIERVYCVDHGLIYIERKEMEKLKIHY